MRLATPRDAINGLAERLRKAHKHYAGARFRAAFLKQDMFFLTGSVVFWTEELSVQPTADYGVLVFADHWQSGENEALNMLSQVLSGQGEISGQKIRPGFGFSDLEDHSSIPFGIGTGGWSGWEMRSFHDPGLASNANQNYLQDSILGFGLRPYRGGNQAINDRVFGLSTSDAGGSIPYPNYLVTFLPDTRARVLSALWTPGKLDLSLEINVPSNEVELQILYLGSAVLPPVTEATTGSLELSVPGDTREILVYLVHRGSECIATAHLRHVYASFGRVPKELVAKSKIERDLAKGEGEQIEFKPFIAPNDPKETEIIETVVAFANTSGGRIYVGVADRDASLLGSVPLRKAFKGPEEEALKQQASRLKVLILHRILPTARVKVEETRIFDAPLVTITVETSGQTHYDRQNNDVRVRRGASNIRPGPDELLQLTSSDEF